MKRLALLVSVFSFSLLLMVLLLAHSRRATPSPMFLYAASDGKTPGLNLYRATLDDGDPQLVQRFKGYPDLTQPVQASDGTWYFTQWGETKAAIYRMGPDGGHPRKISQHADNAFFWSFSPDHAWIVYRVVNLEVEGDFKLYRMRLDGTQRQLLTPHEGSFRAIAWSPDGNWLVFEDLKAEGAIYRMRPDGSQRQRLAETSDTILGWSPDGQWLVFSAVRDEQMHIYRVAPDGSQLTELTPGFRRIEQLVWSPDGAWLYFVAVRSLYRVALVGGTPELVTDYAGFNTVASFSSDGQWIVFYQRESTCLVLYRMRPDGSDLQRLLPEMQWHAFVAWSPNSEWLYFRGGLDHVDTDFYRIHPDGTSLERLTTNHDERKSFAAWSPDKQWFVYIERDGYLYKMGPDGSAAQQLTAGGHPQQFLGWVPPLSQRWHTTWLAAAGLLVLLPRRVRQIVQTGLQAIWF